MQAIPINFYYGKSKYNAQRRSSEPHIYDKKFNDGNSRLVSRQIPVNVHIHNLIRLYSRITSSTPSIQCEHHATKLHKQRVLNRLSIHQSNPTTQPTQPTQPTPPTQPTTHPSPPTLTSQSTQPPQPTQPIQPITIQPISNHYKHIKLQTPQHTPKPNRNFYRRRSTPKTPSHTRSHHHSHSVDYTITPFSNKIHKRKSKNRRKSPIFSSITRESKHKKRSHSFSISRTYENNSKAYTRRLPTHYSPSITHYSPQDLKTPEITPPPQQLPPAITTHCIHSNKNIRINIRQRSRSKSLSHSFSKSKPSSHHKKDNTDNNTLTIPSTFNIAHILKMSDHENEREIKEEQETIQINNGKSLLFSSWFSFENNTEPNEEFDLLNINQSEIDDAIHELNDMHNSSPSEEVNKEESVIKETQSNASFTMGLKPPRKYNSENNAENGGRKEEMISFRDFLAQENRKALQREIVNVENKTRKKREKIIREKNVDRFFILKGNTMKVDYGLPDGPYTLYKFIITYNHKYTPPSTITKQCKSAESTIHNNNTINYNYDESPRKKTSHWSIRKRYSDFVTFNNNVIAEIKELKGKTIKLPKLPSKTFKKNFNPSFVSSRHAALLSYLNKVIIIHELQSSITLLTFLGAINNHTVPYNDKFLDSRMTLSVYISNYADTGDVLLFETKSYIAASLRSVTSSNYDHVALVYRDIDGTHKCTGQLQNNQSIKCNVANGLYLIESTIDGVRTYPLKSRLKQWSLLCPQIVVRRLKLLKPGIQEKKMRVVDEWQSSSLNSIKHKQKDIYTKYDYAVKCDNFYNLSGEFVQKVNGLDYAIWSNVFRLSDVPFEKQKSFFCSQLVTAFFKFMNLLPKNVKTHRILPGHFSDDRNNKIKLPLKNCLLLKENLLLFKLPNINNAKHHQHYAKHHQHYPKQQNNIFL